MITDDTTYSQVPFLSRLLLNEYSYMYILQTVVDCRVFYYGSVHCADIVLDSCCLPFKLWTWNSGFLSSRIRWAIRPAWIKCMSRYHRGFYVKFISIFNSFRLSITFLVSFLLYFGMEFMVIIIYSEYIWVTKTFSILNISSFYLGTYVC